MVSSLSVALAANPNFIKIRKYIISIIMGGALTAGFPPVYFVLAVPFAFFGLSILFYKSKSLKESIILGLLSGSSFGALSFYWFYFAIKYTTSSSILGVLAVGGAALGIGVFFIGIAITSYFMPKNRVWLLLLFNTAIWSTAEIIRGTLLFGGLPWNVIAEVWDADIYMLQLSAIVGVYGLGFITYLIMGSLLVFFNPNAKAKDRYIMLGLLIAVVAVAHYYGYNRIAVYNKLANTNTQIAIFQPNVSQNDKMTGFNAQQHFNNLFYLTRTITQKRSNLVVVWPETAIDYPYQNEAAMLTHLKGALNNKATLISGVERSDVNNNYYNSALVYNPEADYMAYYNKNHLVPFGEYIPVLSNFKATKGIVNDFTFTRGESSPVFTVNNIPSFQVLICFEAIFPNALLNNRNIKFLINIANDAWYDNSNEPYQHLSLIKFRAIEGGIPIIRSSNTGISAVVNSVGQIKKHMALFSQGYIITTIPSIYPALPLFALLGNNLIMWINFGIVLLLLYYIFKEYIWRLEKI